MAYLPPNSSTGLRGCSLAKELKFPQESNVGRRQLKAGASRRGSLSPRRSHTDLITCQATLQETGAEAMTVGSCLAVGTSDPLVRTARLCPNTCGHSTALSWELTGTEAPQACPPPSGVSFHFSWALDKTSGFDWKGCKCLLSLQCSRRLS